jgi:cytochrome c oxidase cbb3-type subunit 3
VYDAACVVCHARGDTRAGRSPWQPEALSNDHVYDPEAVGHHDDYSDPPFGLHASAPVLRDPGRAERRGEALYRDNCAFCHAADGSGRNWIGAFMVPAPPDFTRPSAAPRSADDLLQLVGRGIPGTSMPAWDGVLDAADLRAVVAYLRAAFPAFASPTSRAP